MILTREIFEQGRSSNNGHNAKQLIALGEPGFKSGWYKRIIGKDFPEDKIKLFLDLKDTHLSDPEYFKKRREPFIDAPNVPWKEQYKHPNWQRMRLMVLKRDNFKCVNCLSKHKMLHVHHLKYNRSGAIWEVPLWYMVTLCEDCHSNEHGRDLTIKNTPLF